MTALLALLASLLLLLAACGGPVATDPYADPGTPPPAAITDPTIATSGSIAASDKGAGLFDINIAGFAAPDSAGISSAAVAELDKSAFTVVEDGVVKGITVERIGEGGTRAAADVVFVFDTTGSMGSALQGVKDSIVEFVNYLDEGGLDVRVGAVTYGDAYDTLADGATRGVSLRGDVPPSFDVSQRPTFDLSLDFEAFRDFIAGDSPRGGGDVPENGLGALQFAYDNLAWRGGAQRIMVFITDVCQHSNVTFENSFSGSVGFDHWMPPTTASLISNLRGNAVVHAIAPASACGEDYVSAEAFTGTSGTGGVFVDWDYGVFDLTTLPIAAAARGGYVVTYRGTVGGAPKTVRVVIDDGGSVRGEFTVVGDY